MPMSAIDYEDIRQLLARYNFAIDLGDVDAWAACFTADGAFECSGLPEGNPFGGRYVGTEALRAYATAHFATFKGRARHWNGNLEISGDGATAMTRCYMLLLTVGHAPTVSGTPGIYSDQLRKIDDRWLFVERHVTVDG